MTTVVENDLAPLDEKYFFDTRQVYVALKEKGGRYLFHANTVATSKTFIEAGALLSRDYVESNKLFQTAQDSDPEDKKYNVWDDVFVDGLDLHEKYNRANRYGSVLFVIETQYALRRHRFLKSSLQKTIHGTGDPGKAGMTDIIPISRTLNRII